MPGIRIRQALECLEGIGCPLSVELYLGAEKAGQRIDREMDHIEPVPYIRNMMSVFMRRNRCGNKPYLIQPELTLRVSCELYMPVMDGIEGAAEYSCFFHFLLCILILPEAGRSSSWRDHMPAYIK